MAFSLTSPITGATQTGFTSPTYTLTADVAPDTNGKQWAVTAAGGTQTGVDVHTVSKPFIIRFVRPKSLQVAPVANPTTGLVKGTIPRNTYRLTTIKGAVPLANQSAQLMSIETIIRVPAGTDTYEPEDLRAALSAHIGALNQQSAGIGDTIVSGVM